MASLYVSGLGMLGGIGAGRYEPRWDVSRQVRLASAPLATDRSDLGGVGLADRLTPNMAGGCEAGIAAGHYRH
jgi:hypothetical protein